MATKKRPALTPTRKKVITSAADLVLTEKALADLQYLAPARARDRVISCLNELFVRMYSMERAHDEPALAPKKPRRR